MVAERLTMATRFDTYEKYAKQLENIAKTLDENGAAHAALERAGWALAFATMHHHEEFEEFLTAHHGELTADQIAHLKELGLL
jgi:phosphoglycolate phosphatase-like HAD superfamily hydrolase